MLHTINTFTIKGVKVRKKPAVQKAHVPSSVSVIIESIREKKGERIVSIDLRKLDDAPCNFFVICEATSSTQVKAIAHSVEESMRRQIGDRPWHMEGVSNQEWILLDYVDVVVHIFQTHLRSFYQLEELWSDGLIEEHYE